MKEKELEILKKLIEKIILPKYSQIYGIYSLDAEPARHANGLPKGYKIYSLILKVKNYEFHDSIVDEIYDVFKMSGLDQPDSSSIRIQGHKLNKLNIDFSY